MRGHVAYRIVQLRDSGVLISLTLSSVYFTAFIVGAVMASSLGNLPSIVSEAPLIGFAFKTVSAQVRLAVSEGARPDVIAYMIVLGAAIRSLAYVVTSCVPLLPAVTLFEQGSLFSVYGLAAFDFEAVILGFIDSLSLGMVFGGLVALARNERRRSLLAYGIMLQYVASMATISYSVAGMVIS